MSSFLSWFHLKLMLAVLNDRVHDLSYLIEGLGAL